MAQEQAAAPGKRTLWAGRILSGLVVLLLLMSGVMKLAAPGQVLPDFTGKFGYSGSALLGIGLTEVVCALLYAYPRTAVLGAILVTGYMGGATATHVRIGEAFLPAVLVGVFAWAGLFLREPRLRALLPTRQD